MFIDRQKLDRAYLDELTKIGNLFDTLNIDYCVIGSFSLFSYGIKSKASTDCKILIHTTKKDRIISMLFKLNYTLCGISNNILKIVKEVPGGTVSIDLVLGKSQDKKIIFNIKDKELKVNEKFFVHNRKEVKTRKGGKGYFRIAPLELIYFTKMNSKEEGDLFDLEMIKASSKIEIEKLMELFEINGLI